MRCSEPSSRSGARALGLGDLLAQLPCIARRVLAAGAKLLAHHRLDRLATGARRLHREIQETDEQRRVEGEQRGREPREQSGGHGGKDTRNGVPAHADGQGRLVAKRRFTNTGGYDVLQPRQALGERVREESPHTPGGPRGFSNAPNSNSGGLPAPPWRIKTGQARPARRGSGRSGATPRPDSCLPASTGDVYGSLERDHHRPDVARHDRRPRPATCTGRSGDPRLGRFETQPPGHPLRRRRGSASWKWAIWRSTISSGTPCMAPAMVSIRRACCASFMRRNRLPAWT